MSAIRAKSIGLTGYLEDRLRMPSKENTKDENRKPYTIITPSNPGERGAQLSLRLKPGLLECVMKSLEDAGVVVDERKPDVIRVAPAPLYNSYCDIWDFVQNFEDACQKAQDGQLEVSAEAVVLQGQREKNWSQIP